MTKLIQFSRTILRSIRTYFHLALQNANRTMMVIQINNGDSILNYFLSPVASLILALGIGALLGLIFGLGLVGLVLLWEWILYKFSYKRVFKNATWADFVKYRNNPNSSYHVLQTRGGTITLEDVFDSIDNVSNAVNPIIKFLNYQCFYRTGLYQLNLEKWQSVIKSLDKLGAIKWLAVKGKVIGIVTVDAFLIQALRLSSLTINVPVIGHISIAVHELSRIKMAFNILGLLTTVFLGGLFTTLAFSQFIFFKLGLIGVSSVIAEYASVSASALLTVLNVYLIGQFTPPTCANVARYLEDANIDIASGKIKMPFSELPNTDVLIHVPDRITGFEVFDTSATSNDLLPSRFETLGSLFKEPYFKDYVSRPPQVKRLEHIIENPDFNPSSSSIDTPVFQQMKEKVGKILSEDPALE